MAATAGAGPGCGREVASSDGWTEDREGRVRASPGALGMASLVAEPANPGDGAAGPRPAIWVAAQRPRRRPGPADMLGHGQRELKAATS